MKKSKILMITPLLLAASLNVSSTEKYKIDAISNDEKIVINDSLFSAKTYCLGWDEGDEIIFLDGSPYGSCVSAELYNITKGEKCDVWCE